MNTFNLTLDLNKSRASSPVRLRQGDKSGTTISALILDHGATADLTGMTAQLVVELPDGTQYYRKSASVSGNVVTVVVDESTAASVSGRTANAYIQMLQGTTVKASTGSFAVEILPDALEGHTVPESYDSAIQDAIDALDAAVEQMPDMVEDVLADHPEWTTTVQDGSITKAKLATDLARDRERMLYRLANMLTAQLPEGDVATATDAAQTPVAGLALYGRSTQGGTPTPSAPVPIVSVAAANLLDVTATGQTIRGITYAVDGGVVTASGTASGGNSVLALGTMSLTAGTYALSGITGGSGTTYSLRVYKVSGNATIKYVNNADTFALDADAEVGVQVYVYNGATVSGLTLTPMLVHGSTPMPYVPYGNVGLWAKRTSDASTYTVTPVPLDGHELRSLPDGTRDELTVGADGHAVLVQRVGSVTLDGSESWSKNGSSGYYVGAGSTVVPDAKNADTRQVPVYMSQYEWSATAAVWASGHAGINVLAVWIGDSTWTSVDAFKAHLATSPMTMLYPLATPVTHDLGYVDAVPLCGPDLTAQAIPTAPFALTYERDLNATLARLESAIATLA